MWIDEQREWPRAGAPVIGMWGERYDHEVGWVVRTEDDGWYSANPDGSPINRCPAPEVWQHPPTRLRPTRRTGAEIHSAPSAAPRLSGWARVRAWMESRW